LHGKEIIGMELWDILDENGNSTGRLVERGKPMRQDEFHLVVHVWIVNSKKQLLISKRAHSKIPFGGMWETTGGSAITGETSLEAALRETKEELGIDLTPGDCKFFTRVKRQYNDFPDFVDAWLCKFNKDLTTLKPDPAEVSETRWAERNEIREMIAQGIFMNVFPYLDGLFEQI
jgi:isopentenyldiphosphate isomerase